MSIDTPDISDTSDTSEITPIPTDATAGATDSVASSAIGPAKPRHPMPMHFPELRHHEPKSEAQPVIAQSVATQPVVLQPALPPLNVTPAPVPPPDPHSIHDGKGYQPERSVCVRCGSTNLSSGYVVDYGDKFRQVHFAPRRITLNRLNSLLNLWPFRGLAKLDAVACRDCGAVLLTVDASELRRAERRRE